MRPGLFVIVLAACGGAPTRDPAAISGSGGDAPTAAPDVLVPAALDDVDQQEAMRVAIAREVAAAAAGADARWTIHVTTTADYGCLCPPFVFAPLHNNEDPFVMLTAPAAALPPVDVAEAVFRITGRFDGRRLDGFAWAAETGVSAPADRDGPGEAWGSSGPVFVVDDWCLAADPRGQLASRDLPRCAR